MAVNIGRGVIAQGRTTTHHPKGTHGSNIQLGKIQTTAQYFEQHISSNHLNFHVADFFFRRFHEGDRLLCGRNRVEMERLTTLEERLAPMGECAHLLLDRPIALGFGIKGFGVDTSIDTYVERDGIMDGETMNKKNLCWGA